MSLVRIVYLYFEEEYSTTFNQVFLKYKPILLQQVGCQNVQLYQVEGQSQDFVTISQWRNKDDLERYRQSDVFRKMWSNLKPHFYQKPNAHSLIVV